MITNKNILRIALFSWIVIAILYCRHTPHDHRTHDIWGHVPYTKIIVSEHRLPKPYEGWEAYQPPLYYIINSFVAPLALMTDEKIHVNYVRALSVLYGAISLLIIGWLLHQVVQDPVSKLLSLLFIATTPAFVYVFSTYNNDSLMTVLCITMVAVSYRLNNTWSWKLAAVLLLVTTAVLYTKLISLFAIVTIFVCCCKNLLQRKLPNKTQLKIMGILLTSCILLSPWLYFNNYKHTGKLSPISTENMVNRKYDFTQFKNLLGLLFKIPELQINKIDYSHEWDDPWQHPNWQFVHPATKRYDYWGNVFVISLIGEYIIEKPDVAFIWFIYLIHLVACIFGLMEMRRSTLTKLSAFIILFTHFLQILTIPMFPDLPQRNMAYRYICWTWIGWAVLYASTLSNHKYSSILNKVFTVGIAVQVYILMTITGTSF